MINVKDICPKCGGKGLLPFIKPDGTISKFAQVFCDCHPTYGENAYESIPLVTEGRRPGVGSMKLPRKIPQGRRHLYIDDFDFPISYDCYRGLCQLHGWADPGPDRPLEIKAQTQEIIHRHSNMGKKEFNLLQQTAREVESLRDKIIELQPRKPKGISTYKGIK